MTLTFILSEFGRTFATRERGAELRALLLARAVGHDEVVVDFADVSNVSYSFADEFLAKLCAEGDLPVRRTNVIERVAGITDRAIARRNGRSVAC